MRILYISGDHGIPAFGRKGASTHLREMIAAFRRAGCKVALAASDLSGDRREDEDFPTHKLPRPTAKILGSDGRYWLADRGANGVLRNAAVRFRPDAIFERSALYFRAGERLAGSFRIPRLLEVNTLLSEELRNRLHWPKAAARAEEQTIRAASGICAISDVMRDRLVSEFNLPAEGVRTFTMAVDPGRFKPRGRAAIVRKKLDIDLDTPLIGFVGSMNHYHKPAWFMDLVERLATEQRNVQFALVGGSDAKVSKYRSRAAQIEGARVHFEGTVPQDELADWIEAMDLVVIPGAAPQSTPTKIFEVAAIGTSLVLPATVPISKLCKGAAEDLLFPEEDFDALVQRVSGWLDNREALTDATKALRETVLAEYTWDHHAKEIIAWFESLRA
ncbi:glycosyltransferase family 4 protein [bacterium]|nr:glycosyltransferase family 4 protein [bacterium]